MIYLLLSCDCEREVDPIVLDAHDINEGDSGWCQDHPAATVTAIQTLDPDTRTWVARLMGARA